MVELAYFNCQNLISNFDINILLNPKFTPLTTIVISLESKRKKLLHNARINSTREFTIILRRMRWNLRSLCSRTSGMSHAGKDT